MVRRITFTVDTEGHFPWLWEGLLVGIVVKDMRERTSAQKKMEAKVLQKMKSISVMDPEGRQTAQKEDLRVLKAPPQILELTSDELKLLVEYAELPPWLGSRLEPVFAATTFAESAEHVKE